MSSGMKKRKTEIDVVVDVVENTIKTIESKTDKVSEPLRRTLFKRFPIIAVLAVAFGVTATASGAQLLFMKVEFFVDHPGVLMTAGLIALVVMGKLHQKFG